MNGVVLSNQIKRYGNQRSVNLPRGFRYKTMGTAVFGFRILPVVSATGLKQNAFFHGDFKFCELLFVIVSIFY